MTFLFYYNKLKLTLLMSDVGLSNSITLPLEITLSGGTPTQVRVNTSTPDNKHHIKDRPTIIVYPLAGQQNCECIAGGQS
jgi:hypothetical protein